MPPPITVISSASFSLKISSIRGKEYVCAPDRMLSPIKVHVFLNGGAYDLLRRLMATGIDDFETGITKGTGHYSSAAVVAVQTWLGNQYTEFPFFFHGNLPP